MTDEGVKTLAKLPKLKTLDLSHTGITSAAVVSLKGHSGLRELNLGCTRVGNAGIEALSGNENLTLLDIAGTEVNGAGMIHVGKLRHLRTLYVTGIPNEALAAIEELVELEEFSGPIRINDVGLYHLRKMKNMRCIGGSMHLVTDNGLKSIPPLRISESLTSAVPASRTRE